MVDWNMPETRISSDTVKRLDAAWPALLDKVAEGEQIGKAIESMGFTRDVVRCYWSLFPERKRLWDVAKESSADALADQALETASDRTLDPAFARVRIDLLKWLAAKRNPRLYNDKQTIDLNVKTVDLTAVIQDANRRLAHAQQGRLIEGEVIRLALPQASIEDYI